jgi:hypothetical protein
MTVYHPQLDDRMVMRKQRFMECVIVNAARVEETADWSNGRGAAHVRTRLLGALSTIAYSWVLRLNGNHCSRRGKRSVCLRGK